MPKTAQSSLLRKELTHPKCQWYHFWEAPFVYKWTNGRTQQAGGYTREKDKKISAMSILALGGF